ncbi:MAG TPA: tRNA 2-thiouridine(34) synthase MnmA [Actinomycetota bacterium]|jgi:tRNA-specific 2-thiouridylase|nr:tRNA 2-thiouridine(34) synthase MnmA [Actinomycetota bacterium]
MRLLAAMSGGVDSSVAAALARQAGHDVTGVTLKQWEFPDEETRLVKGCCTLDAVADARRAADVIGIAHYTLDFRDSFAAEVVGPFVADYANGLTPNPCVRCNERVRFGALWERAQMLGFDGLITGHYARVQDGRLLRARNRAKDQSYVLYAVGRAVLERVLFPIGEIESKDDVRELAHRLGLPNAGRDDSVEVCFVGEGRKPGDVIAERVPAAVRSGPIVDRNGEVVGEHRGLPFYTIGQRRGLGSFGSQASYVTALLPHANTLVVGDRPALQARGLEAVRPRFVAGIAPADGAALTAVVRYHGAETEATFTPTGDGFRLEFARPVESVAPGQAVVLYDGDEVVGGGTIARALA